MDEKLLSQLNPIFREIGIVVQSSQQMEFAIRLSLTMLENLNAIKFSDEDVKASMHLFSRKTLGMLIGEYKKQNDLDDKAIDALQLSLEERNFIVHRFFNEESGNMITKKGRAKALARIQQARTNIHPGYKVLDQMLLNLMAKLDIDTKKLSEETILKIEI